MPRIVLALVATLLLAGCSASAQTPPGQTQADRFITAQLMTARTAGEQGRPEVVMASLEQAMGDEVFGKLSPGVQDEVAGRIMEAAQTRGNWELVHRAALRLTAHPNAQEEAWAFRLYSAIVIGDGADAYAAFKYFDGRDRGILRTFSGRQMDRFDRLLGDLPNAREARLRLGREMEQEHWTPVFVYNDPSLVWLHYAEALLDQGDAAKAKSVALRVTDPLVMIAMRSDRRFDAIVAANPTLQDPSAAAERYLDWARDYVQKNPRVLSGRIAVVRALFILNRPTEALAVTQETVRMMAHGSRAQPAFDDMDEAQVFEGWKDAALISVGRVDEGIGGLTTAASCHCSALATVELGQSLLAAGRADEAKEWVSGADETGLGPEDRMTLSETRACAAAQMGDTAAVAKELQFLAGHESWKPGANVHALICADRLDQAAAQVARQIADPRSRLTALAAVQSYAAESGASPYANKLMARWSKVIAMPVVQAEVAKAGRIDRFDLQSRGPIA